MARAPFNNRWAQSVETQSDSTTFQVPDNDRQQTGWEGGLDKDAPPAGQENWWHNRADSALQDIERTGVMSFHLQAIYGAGAPAYGSDGNYYESLASGNTGNDPTTTTGYWRFVGTSFFSGSDPGDLKQVAHNAVPSTGWLKCNGSVLNKASYTRLFAKIGTTFNSGGESSLQFRLPDFRGMFARGFDDGRGTDSGRTFGTTQSDDFRSHSHVIQGFMPINANVLTPVRAGAELSGVGIGGSPSVASTGGAETRPINIAINYWIKY